MPIQFPDMMQVPKPEEANPFLSQLTKGLQLAVGFPAELKEMDIANALKQMQTKEIEAKLPYMAQLTQAEAGLKAAEARKLQFQMEHPSSLYSGIAQALMLSKELEDEERKGNNKLGITQTPSETQSTTNIPTTTLHKNPIDEARHEQSMLNPVFTNPSTALKQYVQDTLTNQNTKAQALVQSQQIKKFMAMPYNMRGSLIAQAAAFGMPYNEASERLINGEKLEDMAKEYAKSHPLVDPKNPKTWPLPDFAPTIAMLTRQGQANIAQAGISAIEPIITEWTAPYAQKVPLTNFSIKQLREAISGKNEDEQAKAIAGYSFAMELQLLRLRSGGIQNIGIEALRHALDVSLGNMKTLGFTMTENVYRKAQKHQRYIAQKLNNAENRALTRYQQDLSDQEDKAYDTGFNANAGNENGGMTDEEIAGMKLSNEQ